jgi:hypothetical protein
LLSQSVAGAFTQVPEEGLVSDVVRDQPVECHWLVEEFVAVTFTVKFVFGFIVTTDPLFTLTELIVVAANALAGAKKETARTMATTAPAVFAFTKEETNRFKRARAPDHVLIDINSSGYL